MINEIKSKLPPNMKYVTCVICKNKFMSYMTILNDYDTCCSANCSWEYKERSLKTQSLLKLNENPLKRKTQKWA